MILLQLSPDDASMLGPIRAAIENGDVPSALKMVRSQAFPSSALAPLHLLEIQGLIEQGLLRDAFNRCEALLSLRSFEEPFRFELRLRHAFLKVFFQRSPDRGVSALRVLANQSARYRNGSHGVLRALACDLLARSLTLAVGWHAMPPSMLCEARQLHDTAARLFQESGAFSESVASLIALGQLALQGQNPTPALARAVFSQAQLLAQQCQLPYRQLEAALLLGEVEQDHFRLKAPSLETLYGELSSLANNSDHVLALAVLRLSTGQRLIRAGKDGVPMLVEALHDYERFGSARGAYACLSALGAHYYQSGDLTQAETFFARARESAETIGAPIFIIANKVAQISLALPKGNRETLLEMARDIHRATNACYPARVIASFTLSNVYAHLDQPQDAEAMSLATIRTLKRSGPSPTLALAYFIHGNTLASVNDWKKAFLFWKKSYDIERHHGDIETTCQRLQCLALASVMRVQSSKDSGVIDIAYAHAQRYLSQAQRLVMQAEHGPQGEALQDKLQAGIDQMLGQLALLCDQLEDGLFALEGALARYKRQNLEMPLGFTHAQLGLLLYELGKNGDLISFPKAAEHQEDAYQLFSSRGLHSIAWRISFHRALTEYRMAGNPNAKTWKVENVRRTLTWLHRSAHHIEFAKRPAETPAVPEPAVGDTAFGVLPNLVNDTNKVYNFAIQICAQLLNNWPEALRWMERKARHCTTEPFFNADVLSN